MTRIIAGSARGRTLVVPSGRETRPTSDRVREALFSQLDGEIYFDSHLGVLDLYAGSGALGLEAASRGAGRVVLVESGRAAADACRRNVEALGLGEVVTVRQQLVASFLRGEPDEPFDLVLLDPPYPLAEEDLAAALAALVGGGWLGRGGVVVVERSTRGPEPSWPSGLLRFDRRRHGETTLWLAEHEVDPSPT